MLGSKLPESAEPDDTGTQFYAGNSEHALAFAKLRSQRVLIDSTAGVAAVER
jgi:hypothetical protein